MMSGPQRSRHTFLQILRIAVTVDEVQIEEAARVVHAAFDLDKAPQA